MLTEIKVTLANHQPAFHQSPLDRVIESLSRGRHYPWVGIYLTTQDHGPQQVLGESGQVHPAQISVSSTHSKVLVSIRLAGHEFGVLGVETDQERRFGIQDRVLLENVATLLARYLTGPGKYLVRRARLEQSAQCP